MNARTLHWVSFANEDLDLDLNNMKTAALACIAFAAAVIFGMLYQSFLDWVIRGG